MRPEYLRAILERKRREIGSLGLRAAELKAAAAAAAPARPWREALRRRSRVALIAELKRRAPSAGPLRPDMDAGALARTYEEAGAAALSVLTDRDFDGQLNDLRRARAEVSIPALRKDFILDRVQLWESRAAGADAALLIVRALSDGELAELMESAGEVGLATLVEVHDEVELDRALAAGASVIGINNRDLTTFSIDLDVTRRLALAVPRDRIVVAESGIETVEQVREMGELGVDAVLVGRALVSSPQPAALARSLASQRRVERP